MIRRIFAILLVTVLAAWAGTDPAGSISGTVKDPQGAVVPGAALTLISRSGAVGGATTTDGVGAYRFEALPEGDYLLRAAAPGFAPFLAGDIHVSANAPETHAIVLQIAGVAEQVVVTAASTPQLPEHVSKAVTVIDQTDADARGAKSLADVIDLAPGIRVQQLGGPGAFTTVQIRGMRDQDTALLVDGLRLRDASATQADASGLIEDLLSTNASRVEVMGGSGSSLYGTNAIGGVVNVITDEGGGRTRGSVLLEGGSLGAFHGRAQVAGGFRGDRIEYSLGVADTDVTGGVGGDAPFRDVSTQGRVTFHLAPSVRLTARLYGADSFSKVLGDAGMIGSYSGFGIVNAVEGVTFSPAADNPDYTRAARFLSAALTLNGQASPRFDYSLSYQLVTNGRRYGDGPAGAGYQPAGSTRSLYDGRIQTVDAQAHYKLGRYNLVSAGYEFENEHYANDNTDATDAAATNAVNATQKSHSVFAQDQAQLFGGRLQLSAAFRAQLFTLDAPVLLPLAEAPYQKMSFASPAPAYTGDFSAAYFFKKTGTKLRGHAGRGYRSPSLFERFGDGFDPIYGYTVYGDPRLKPEHSMSFDAGIDQVVLKGRLQASASYFYTWLDNVIDFDTSGKINFMTDPFGRFIGYLNAKGGISRGVESSVSAAPVRRMKVTASYTYVNAIERTPIVGDVIQAFTVPRNQFSFLVAEQANSRLTFTLDTRVSGSYLAPIYGDYGTQTYRFGGMHKINAGASYRLPLKDQQALRFFARADNLFDQTFFENGYLTPGRTASAGLQFEF